MEATKSFEFDYEIEDKTIHFKTEGDEYEEIFKLAILYKIEFDSKPRKNMGDENFIINLPINKIDGKMVDFDTRTYYYQRECVFNPCHFLLSIDEPDRYMFCNEEIIYHGLFNKTIYSSSSTEPNQQDFIKAIMIIKYYINNLKFDKIENEFVLNKKDNKIKELSCSVFRCENVSMSIDTCSVCYESTSYKLSCNHYLCLICRETIQKKQCPLCKKKYNNCDKTHYDNDSDEEED